MNEGRFIDNVNVSKKLFKELNLLNRFNPINIKNCSSKKYSLAFKQSSLKKIYKQTYIIGLENQDYDLLLVDQSFLQFSYDLPEGKIRLAFYPNPDEIKTYNDFLKKYDYKYSDVGDIFQKEFEQYLCESDIEIPVTPIRYDYDEAGYKELVHHTSHLHIGQNNNIRIGTIKEISPLSFSALIINYFYLNIWENVIENNELKTKILSVKNQCDNLSDEYFSRAEKQYFYII